MSTTDPSQRHATPGTPDVADILAAGRLFPTTTPGRRYDHAAAAAHLRDIRGWWLEAAGHYLDIAETALIAGDATLGREALNDARRARANAELYAPSKALTAGEGA